MVYPASGTPTKHELQKTVLACNRENIVNKIEQAVIYNKCRFT